MSTNESSVVANSPSAPAVGGAVPSSRGQPGSSGRPAPTGLMARFGSSVLGLSPVTWALLASAAGMQYFGSAAEEPVKERAEKTETERVQENAGMNVDFLGQIKTWADQYVANKQIPGMVVGISHKGKLVYNEGFGAYSTDSILAIKEMGQLIVTAACLTLVDKNKLSLEDPVSKYIPSFSNFRVLKYPFFKESAGVWATEPLRSPILIRHLLNHTWGFPSGRPFHASEEAIAHMDREVDSKFSKLEPGKTENDFAKMANVPLLFQPGKGFRKTVGVDVLAHIACKISGTPLDQFVQTTILDPCRMSETGWFVTAENKARATPQYLAVPAYTGTMGLALTGKDEGHTSWLGWRIAETKRKAPIGKPYQGRVNSNGIYSTCEDVMKFMRIIKSDFAGTILSQRMVSMLTTDSLKGQALSDKDFNTHGRDTANSAGFHPSLGASSPGQGMGYGGTCIVVDPSTSAIAGSAGTFSVMGDMGTEVWHDPKQQISVFVGTQVAPFHAFPQLRQELAAYVYGSLLPKAALPFFVLPDQNQPTTMMSSMMNIAMYMMMFMPMGGL